MICTGSRSARISAVFFFTNQKYEFQRAVKEELIRYQTKKKEINKWAESIFIRAQILSCKQSCIFVLTQNILI